MHVTCPHCEAAYDVELPASVSRSGRKPLKFRCGVCGQRFLIERSESVGSTPNNETKAPVESGARPASPVSSESSASEAASEVMRLRQDGNVYELANLATLQRWIVERRVNPHDEINTGTGEWESIQTRPDLKVFFQLVSQVERAQQQSDAEGATREDLPREDTEEAPWRGDRQQERGQVSFDTEAAVDVFADLKDSEGGEAEEGPYESGEWDPMDPPMPRLRTDHGFNPNALPVADGDSISEEDDTLLHDDADSTPDPKTISLGTPLDTGGVVETPDPFFAGPTESDSLTEEIPRGQDAIEPYPAEEMAFGSIPDDEPVASPEPVFREEYQDFDEDGGPALPAIESAHEPAENEFVSVDESFGGSDDTLFSVTDDDFLDDDDDSWERQQASSARNRKLFLGLIALCGLGFLGAQALDSEDGPEEVVDTTGVSDAVSDDTPAAEPMTDDPVPAEENEEDDALADDTPEETASEDDTTAAEPVESEPSPRSSASQGAANWVDQGWEAYDDRDYDRALEYFSEALDLNRRDAAAHHGTGKVHESLGDESAAINHYCSALRYAREGTDVHRESTSFLNNLGGSCD